MITLDNFGHFKTIIDQLMAQAGGALEQVGETVKDHARLKLDAAGREQVIERLNNENFELQSRIDTLEDRNAKLVEDLIALESRVVELDGILANIRKAANGEPKDQDDVDSNRQGALRRA